jgi:hypothetical protein
LFSALSKVPDRHDTKTPEDLLDPGRINILRALGVASDRESFRSSGPSNDQSAVMLSASVAEYDIADVRGEGTA